MREITEHGLYVVKDSFFDKFPNNTWNDNKGQRRPHYYAFHDSDGVIWLIPLSTKVDTARKTIKKFEDAHCGKECLYCHIGVIAGRERSFNISSMFPVTAEYIERAYTIDGVPFVVNTANLNNEVVSKAKTYLNMVKRGKLYNSRNIFEIKQKLLEK